MTYSFQEATQAFKKDQIRELGRDRGGLRFLKLRSLSRREHTKRLMRDHGIRFGEQTAAERLQALFTSDLTDDQINQTIRAIYSEERRERAAQENALISELYKMRVFDWGGLHQNSLERTIVDSYVKKIRSFDDLQERIAEDLFHSMQSYVLCSWYSHWTSIIIEDIFRDHPSVLLAVGRIKKVDFFVHDVPYDLKVTYLPEGYIKDKRHAGGLVEEITLLKRFARSSGIHFDREMRPARLLEDLWAKAADHPSQQAADLIAELKAKRLEILDAATNDPADLIRWLYENQGVRRFDASSRLFLVLVDCDNFFESWKLKRAKPLLVSEIHSHLHQMKQGGHDIVFKWEGDAHSVTSEVIFVTHRRE